MPELDGIRATWEEALGAHFPAFESFLRLQEKPATSYPCPEPGADGCPRRVVHHNAGDIVAVCHRRPRVCPTLSLKKADLAVYRLDLRLLAARLSDCLGLRSEAAGPVRGLEWTEHAGDYCPIAGLAFPVYLTIPLSREAATTAVERLLGRDGGKFLLVAPTTGAFDAATLGALQQGHASVLGMDSAIGVGEFGALVALRPVQDLLRTLYHTTRVPSRRGREQALRFATPSAATWPNIRMTFPDRENVSIEVLGTRGIYHYSQLGLADGRKAGANRQWQFLLALADGHGEKTWRDRDAQRAYKKHCQELRKDLRRFFGLSGDPIPYVRAMKGWRARFSVSPP